MSARVPATTCCAAVVPRLITATGVAAGRPAATSRRAIEGSAAVPMSTTSVSTLAARPSQSTSRPGFEGSS
jgi:hypothetical protein